MITQWTLDWTVPVVKYLILREQTLPWPGEQTKNKYMRQHFSLLIECGGGSGGGGDDDWTKSGEMTIIANQLFSS